MKLYDGRFRSRKSMKKALGMSGSGGSSGYYKEAVQTDSFGNRFVMAMSKTFARPVKHMLSARGR